MTMHTDYRRPAASHRGALAGPAGGLFAAALAAIVAIVEALLGWQERSRQRHHLQGLDDRLLKDLGLDRADVSRESAKPFWRD